MPKIKFQFILRDSEFYKEAVALRYQIFFQPNGTSISAIFDELEDRSFHLVAICENRVVGYIRLTMNEDGAQLSQFVVAPSMRGKGKIAIKLFEKIIAKAKEEMAQKVYGEIRLHVAKAAEKYGFNVSKQIFPSKKTGILHRRIEMVLK
jgi:predicted GNAT family N-acyltransferase